MQSIPSGYYQFFEGVVIGQWGYTSNQVLIVFVTYLTNMC